MPRLPMVPGIRILDWLVGSGVEVRPREEILADPVCRCVGDLCFHSGIVGPLTIDQQDEFCRERAPFEGAVAERVRRFARASADCGGELGAAYDTEAEDLPLGAMVACLYRKLDEQGLRLG